MNQQITIEVSEQVWQRANFLATQKRRKVKNIIEDLIEESVFETNIEDLSDEEILTLTNLKFNNNQQKLFSNLLKKNRENTLNDKEKLKLDDLMRSYESGLLRKSQALRVAVERGLIEPLKA
jgi:uncharacterized protein YihD (DUF1040 family)